MSKRIILGFVLGLIFTMTIGSSFALANAPNSIDISTGDGAATVTFNSGGTDGAPPPEVRIDGNPVTPTECTPPDCGGGI